MSYDKIFDLTAGVYINFHNVLKMCVRDKINTHNEKKKRSPAVKQTHFFFRLRRKWTRTFFWAYGEKMCVT